MRRGGTQTGNPSCVLQTSVVVFRELCGVSAVANLMQCVLALGSRVSGPDEAPLLLFDLGDLYPGLEPQGPLPEVLRRLVATYDMVRGRRSWRSRSFLFSYTLSLISSPFSFVYYLSSSPFPLIFYSSSPCIPFLLFSFLLHLSFLSTLLLLLLFTSTLFHPLSEAEPPGGPRVKYTYRLRVSHQST